MKTQHFDFVASDAIAPAGQAHSRLQATSPMLVALMALVLSLPLLLRQEQGLLSQLPY